MTKASFSTIYHRWLGLHAVDGRRTVVVAVVGFVVALALVAALGWIRASIIGWDAATATFLATTWRIILRADGRATQEVAIREDSTRAMARVLLVGASVASLVGVGAVLSLAGQASGTGRILLIALGVLTVVLSWTLINTTYTLRYAHLHFGESDGSVDFEGDSDAMPPSFRDFAYLAFTIGMTYQVSDTTLRNPRMRRTVLAHALLSYLFGVVIVAGAINLIGGLLH